MDRKWGVLALLFFSITVNLVDRQVLSVLAPVIIDELHLSNTEYSFIIMSFLLGMALFQVPTGVLLDRRGARWGLTVLMFWWSLANAAHGLARSVAQFSIFRFLMGAGECGNYSGGIKVIAQWFPPKERALAGGIFNSGTVIGAFAAPALIVYIERHFGWRWAFVLPSSLGLLWILPWLAFYRDLDPPKKSTAAAPFAPLLRLRQVWGAVLMRMLAGPVVHFYWYWLPEYLKRERHFSMELIGVLAGIPFLFAGLGNIMGGWFSGRLMRGGAPAGRARRISFLVAAAMCFSSMLVPLVPGEFPAIAIISTATFGISMYNATYIGTLGDLFSAGILARITGLAGMAEGFMNMTFMLATGLIVDRFSYLPIFMAAGLLPALGVAVLFLVIRRIEPVA